MKTQMPIVERSKLSPPQLAKLWGISTEKVLTWIRSGELKAIDAVSRRGERPRYLIDVRDLEAFERSRSTSPVVDPSPRRKRTPEGVMEFFQ
ncbi:MAG: helix-turn-helix domain-containing protein [Planctomycetia bacterium]|nr:helix-turn-helix domain-containing protein [Planctomycetia bacterium]